MAAVDFFTGFDYKWAQDGSVFNWDDAQYKQGWATIGSVPPSVEQFNRSLQVLDEKSNYLFAHVKKAATDAGLTMTSGATDTLSKAIRALSLPIYATTPGSNVGPIVYVIDRQQILLWQTIGTFTGYASAEVGDFSWGTSIVAKPGTEFIIGQTVDRSLPKYAAVAAWAEVNGHMVSSGSWEKGAFHFSMLTGNNMRMPDIRDQFIRATGTDLDTANAREAGSSQADAFQGHWHNQYGAPGRGAGSSWTPSYESSNVTISNSNDSVRAPRSDGTNGNPRTSNETRGKNVAFHPAIIL